MTKIAIGGVTTDLAGQQVELRGRYGTLKIAPDGTYTYSADSNPHMPLDIENVDTFTYSAADSTNVATNTSELAVHITFNGGVYA